MECFRCSMGSRFCVDYVNDAPLRSLCSLRATNSGIALPYWTVEQMIMFQSRLVLTNYWPASAPCCGVMTRRRVHLRKFFAPVRLNLESGTLPTPADETLYRAWTAQTIYPPGSTCWGLPNRKTARR